jgi:hypothetical protein
MKKYSTLLLIVASAVLAVVIMHHLTDRDTAVPAEEQTTHSGEVNAIMALCDSMATRPWDEAEQKQVELRLQIAVDQGLIAARDHLAVVAYLRSSVARARQLAFDAWLAGDCKGPLPRLEKALSEASKWENCSAIVATPLRAAKAYQEALQIAGQSKTFLQGAYDDARAGAIRATIAKLQGVKQITECSDVRIALRRSREQLDAFRDFSVNFQKAENFYQKNPNDYSYKKQLLLFCPTWGNEEIGQYPHYLAILNNYGICPP